MSPAGVNTRFATNGVELAARVAGEGPLVILAHGFPDLGYSWRHQVPALVAAGFRVVAPDMRGYGGSTRPTDSTAYDVLTVGRDLTGILDVLGEDRATFIGHDWGAAVVWALAAAHPERVRGVAGLSVPFTSSAAFAPTSVFRRRFGPNFYMLWFQNVGEADRAMAANVPGALTGTLGRWGNWEMTDPRFAAKYPWLSDEEFDVYVAAFQRTGFTGGLNYYRNVDRNWALLKQFGDRIDLPSLFVTGSADPVRTFRSAHDLEKRLTDLRGHIVLEGAGHWIQHERAGEVNRALLAFLRDVHRRDVHR